MKKGDLLELEIVDYAFEGKGIAKISENFGSQFNSNSKKFIVFVDGSYPGDKVIAQLKKIKKNYADAKIKNIVASSPHRTTSKCKYFGVCGGCKTQDLQYEQQVKFKADQVRDIFERIGDLRNFEMLPILKADKQYFYRNKMEYSFSDKRWLSEEDLNNINVNRDSDFALGLHIPRIFDKVLDIEECWLQSELSNKILNFTRKFGKKYQILPYSAQKHTGFLRNLIIRESFLTKEVMVNLVVCEESERLFFNYKNELLHNFPEITTIVFNINKKLSQVAYGNYEIVGFGTGSIQDLIGKWKFQISANSFFQTNTVQAEKLYSKILAFANFLGNEIVYDLYSGAGTIPIYISRYVKQIYGFENSSSAIQDAITNAQINKVKNFQPILTDLNKSILNIITEKKLTMPDLIVTDPPRSGMNPKIIKDILELSPKKIIYISCNPATQARDIKLLSVGGYKLVKINPVDMFPQTHHIENIALLLY